jgi:uncharacterized circularly permuted ATP-grasp superfamily protein
MSAHSSHRIQKWTQVDNKHYDEVYLPNGKYRPAYAGIMPVVKEISRRNSKRIKKFRAKSLNKFNGDNSLYHIPRMLSHDEYHILHTGVQQRARALQSFLNDHYFNHKSYLKSGLITRKSIDQIISRSHETNLEDKITDHGIKQYGFWYGPDIIRGPSGKFYVCEDNIGFVGGIGDIVLSHQILQDEFPEYKPFLKKIPGGNFYKEMIDSYRRMIRSEEQIVFLYYPRSRRADHEDKRLVEYLESLNVHCLIIPNDGKKQQKDVWHLEVDSSDRVYLIKSGARRVPVGLVILNCESYDIDPRDSAVYTKFLFNEAEWYLELCNKMITEYQKKGNDKYKKIISRRDKLLVILNRIQESPDKSNFHQLKSFLRRYHHEDFNTLLSEGIPGLLQAYFKGQVKLINGPGSDFLGDKLFYPYVDRLIRYYLKEEPILRTIPTLSFSKYPDLISSVFDDPKIQQHVVIKSANGRGGSEVWVGPKISRSQFLGIKDRILKNPSQFLVQQYIPLSQVDNQLVDLRTICSVTSTEVVVLPSFWGRGISATNSNGKVNISDKGFEFAVCQEETRRHR